MTRALELGLRTWAVVQVIVAALWALGPFGTGHFWGEKLPDSVRRLLDDTVLEGVFTGPIIGADLTDERALDRIFELSRELTGDQSLATAAWGDINVGWSVQFSILTWWQGFVWVALHVVPLLVMAGLWWTLAGVVTQSRRETVFTISNARWLTWAGLVVLLGAPLLSLITWRFHNWVADSSQIAERIQVPSYSLGHLPWTAMAAGFALVVLGQVWRRGANMEHELGGLV